MSAKWKAALQYCLGNFADFSDQDWKDNHLRIKDYEAAVEWVRNADKEIESLRAQLREETERADICQAWEEEADRQLTRAKEDGAAEAVQIESIRRHGEEWNPHFGTRYWNHLSRNWEQTKPMPLPAAVLQRMEQRERDAASAMQAGKG